MDNNSGSNSGKLMNAPENLLHPRDYTAPASDSKQSRGPVNVILKLSEDQIFNNSGQGQGIAGPSVYGGPSDDKASQSSAEAGTKVSADCSVSLGDGQHSYWNGGKSK